MTVNQQSCFQCGAEGVPLEVWRGEDAYCARCRARLEGIEEGERVAVTEMAERMFELLDNSIAEPIDIVRAAEGGHFTNAYPPTSGVKGFLELLDPVKVEAARAESEKRFEEDFLMRRLEAELFAARYGGGAVGS